jgi:hypothetical protein
MDGSAKAKTGARRESSHDSKGRAWNAVDLVQVTRLDINDVFGGQSGRFEPGEHQLA